MFSQFQPNLPVTRIRSCKFALKDVFTNGGKTEFAPKFAVPDVPAHRYSTSAPSTSQLHCFCRPMHPTPAKPDPSTRSTSVNPNADHSSRDVATPRAPPK